MTRERYVEKLKEYEEQIESLNGKLKETQKKLDGREKKGRSTNVLRKRIASIRKAIKRQRKLAKRLKIRYGEQVRNLQERLAEIRRRDRMVIEKAKLQIKMRRERRDYNLNTSLRSYIDPRIYYLWGKKVGFDWKLYYPISLQKKFSWVEKLSEEEWDDVDFSRHRILHMR